MSPGGGELRSFLYCPLVDSHRHSFLSFRSFFFFVLPANLSLLNYVFKVITCIFEFKFDIYIIIRLLDPSMSCFFFFLLFLAFFGLLEPVSEFHFDVSIVFLGICFCMFLFFLWLL